MKLTVQNLSGQEVDKIEVDDAVFGIEPNVSVVHQALLAHQANIRAGSASTKTRGEVAGSTAKLYAQKGTGRARAGSIRSPLRRGGGIVFGPRPRDFAQRLPKRMRRLAIRSLLSSKVADGELHVVDSLKLESAKTKEMVSALKALELERSTLVVTGQADEGVKRSVQNLPNADYLPASYLNVGDLHSHRNVLMTVDAVRTAEALWGGERAAKRRAPLPALVGGEPEGAEEA